MQQLSCMDPLKCSILKSIGDWNNDYKCPKCSNTTEDTSETAQPNSTSIRFRFPILSSVGQSKRRITRNSDNKNDNNRDDVKRKRSDESVMDDKLLFDKKKEQK